MLIEEYLSTLEVSPMLVKRAITEIIVIDESVSEEKKILERELGSVAKQIEESEREKKPISTGTLDKELQEINKCYIKVLDADKRKLNILLHLQETLKKSSEEIKEASQKFKETIAKDSLSLKIKKVLKQFEYKIDSDISDEEPLICSCKKPAKEEMAVCDNTNCPIEWYHCSCVGLKATPKKKWLCPLCEKPEPISQ
ncbi:hypothetical protein NEOKW01_0853 [Nematocida sp. AWRm80]|nr:hypothetical protein NEOKW01_0853 [Nematocida sp. AWRm80]